MLQSQLHLWAAFSDIWCHLQRDGGRGEWEICVFGCGCGGVQGDHAVFLSHWHLGLDGREAQWKAAREIPNKRARCTRQVGGEQRLGAKQGEEIYSLVKLEAVTKASFQNETCWERAWWSPESCAGGIQWELVSYGCVITAYRLNSLGDRQLQILPDCMGGTGT